MKILITQYDILLQTLDLLLTRYRKLRHIPGSSPAGRILYPCLPLLRGLKDFLPDNDRQILHQMEDTLYERLVLLRKRRIPPCSLLHQLRNQCKQFVRALPKAPEKWDSPSVLVGSLRTPHQLEICLEYGFYHVPDRQIPADWFPIAYVAIYQSRSMFPDDCGVLFFGRVKRCTPVRRWQIQEIPKFSDALYYRLDVECWEQLEEPISVREIPIKHLLTNLFLLTHSRETPDLAIKSPEHYVFYHALKRALELGDGTVFHHKGRSVRMKKGLLQVHWKGLKIAAFRTEDFLQAPDAIFRELMGIIERKS